MKFTSVVSNTSSRQAAVLVLACAIGIPAWAQQTQPQQASSSTGSSSQQSNAAADQQLPAPVAAPAQEGFWGRVNPWARKKWVKKQTDPINDSLNELDAVNAKNAQDIKDVDVRAQQGIQKAQSSADAANQTAAAGQAAANANNTAQQATNHVGQIGNTVNGIDQYKPVTDATLTFKPGTTELTDDSKQQLDQLASNLTGRMGYIVEIHAQAPGAGSVGIQNSQRIADAVKRYLATDHQVPIFRMHEVALGNVQEEAANADPDAKPTPVKTRSVHVQVMENSLAAQATASR